MSLLMHDAMDTSSTFAVLVGKVSIACNYAHDFENVPSILSDKIIFDISIMFFTWI